MKLPGSLASVLIDGRYTPLSPGRTAVGKLNFDLVLENKTGQLYSWVVYLENDSDAPSPRIRELLGLDLAVPVTGAARLNTLRGDDCTVYSFYPESFPLSDRDHVRRRPTGGRSSNTTAFPYFDIEDSSGHGLVCGIGWSGQWKLDVTRSGDTLRLTAGFQDCDFILQPHEKVRSVRILLYFGQGSEDQLRQAFVRLHRKYYSPIPSFDRDTFFPVSAAPFDRYYWGNPPENGKLNYYETEDAQRNIISLAAKCGCFNAYWLDACWFEGAFRNGVGNYRYGGGFPNGLRGISDLAHRNGMRFILWFEPVRAFEGTDLNRLYNHDRTRIISLPDAAKILANIGDPEIWQYQYEHICRIIEENGVDIYRQDFNIDPYDYLKSIEKPDRIGISQIRFVEGMYRLWDALQVRFPGLIIDNCASGGRLLDVETCMRAIPLLRSDMCCRPSPLAMQNEVLLLSRYLPYHQGGSWDQSPYFMRSSFTTGIGTNFAFLTGIIDPEKEARSIAYVTQDCHRATALKYLGDFRPETVESAMKDVLRLREYWNGDFTPLTPPSDSKEVCIAYCLHLPEEDRGVALVFRREEAPETYILKIPGVDPEKAYALVRCDEDLTQTETTLSGRLLAEGFPVTIHRAPGSLAVFYRSLRS